MAAAQDGLFPSLFGQISRTGVPAAGIVLSAVLATVLVLVQAAGSPGFAAFYNLVVGLSTMAAVIPWRFLRLPAAGRSARAAGRFRPKCRAVAFVFAVFTLYGCGAGRALRQCC
jgi:L-asparagine transporter-like permease